MNVELIRPWQRFRAGHVFLAMPDGQANSLVRFGYGREQVASDEQQDATPDPISSPELRTSDAGSSTGASSYRRSKHRSR